MADSSLKCNMRGKRLRKPERDVNLVSSGNEKDENVLQTHLKRRT